MKAPMRRIDALPFTHSHAHLSPSNLKLGLDHPEPLIHRLPEDLLQDVFLLIVNDLPDCPSIFLLGETTISANFASPPLLFTRVCRRWRVVAYATTAIWSHIKVAFPGKLAEAFKPFLPSLLQFWLDQSGNRPLTLTIERSSSSPHLSEDRLIEILFAERRCWETIIGVSLAHEWRDKFDTPQLRTLECYWSAVASFNAPNLRRLNIVDNWPADIIPTLTCKNLRHLHIKNASPQTIRSTSEIFPHLETIVVDVIASNSGTRNHSVTHSCLESMTLPLQVYWFPRDRDNFVEIFRAVRFPMLQKLTVVGEPGKMEVHCITVALLATTSCSVRVVDFQTAKPPHNVYMDIVGQLLAVVGEVTIRGEVICSGRSTT